MSKEQEISRYELFVSAISLLSIFNIFLYLVIDSQTISYVVITMDVFISVIFFADFIQRMVSAKSKSKYFFKDLGWADLLASIPLPQFKLLRIFRLIKAFKLLNGEGLLRKFFQDRASSALYLVLFFIILLLEFGSIAILAIEGNDPQANIKTASDAIWWVYVTITTVGYGDQYPVTNQGRAIGMVVMLSGVGLFGILTGYLANQFLPKGDGGKEIKSKLDYLESELAEIKSLIKKGRS